MKLDTYQSAGAILERSSESFLYPACMLNWSKAQEYEENTWVKLLDLPSAFSFEEALLLCQHSEDEWLAWIPDYGETVLNAKQFCY